MVAPPVRQGRDLDEVDVVVVGVAGCLEVGRCHERELGARNLNRAWSSPPLRAKVTGAPSGSVAARVSTAVVFSSTVASASLVNPAARWQVADRPLR